MSLLIEPIGSVPVSHHHRESQVSLPVVGAEVPQPERLVAEAELAIDWSVRPPNLTEARLTSCAGRADRL